MLSKAMFFITSLHSLFLFFINNIKYHMIITLDTNGRSENEIYESTNRDP